MLRQKCAEAINIDIDQIKCPEKGVFVINQISRKRSFCEKALLLQKSLCHESSFERPWKGSSKKGLQDRFLLRYKKNCPEIA